MVTVTVVACGGGLSSHELRGYRRVGVFLPLAWASFSPVMIPRVVSRSLEPAHLSVWLRRHD